jgi:beta-glucanase (GH16 family)
MLLCAIAGFASCDGMNDLHLKYLETGEKIYAAKVDSISPAPGNKRIEMEVFIYAQRIDHLRFYWNAGADSLDFAINNQIGVFRFMIENLPEREYLFEVVSFDKFGNRSLPFEVSSLAYGESYRSYLVNRRINSVSRLEGGMVAIEWLGLTEDAVFTTLRYKDSQGQDREIVILPTESTTTIDDYKPGSEFRYVTAYRPVANSPDLFETEETTGLFPEEKWQLVWEEDFNRTDGRFDETVWSKIPRGNSGWNNYMSDYEPLYSVTDGKLILRGLVNHDQSTDPVPFITGGVYTRDKKLFTYGRLEIKAKLHGATGAWPAIWMLPQVGGWPDGGEIDIMERHNYDNIVGQTVHTYYTHTLNIKEPPQSAPAPIDPDDYNVYSVEIYPNGLRFYVNDYHTLTYPRIDTAAENKQYPFGLPFYLLIDMQLGGWVGEVNPDELPVEMWIDWVRYYQ